MRSSTERGVWALVPAKASARAKMRLSEVLSVEERAALQRAMLEDVLSALSRARRLAGIAVIGEDCDTAETARRHGALFFEERQPAGLNRAVADGTERLRRLGARMVAVVPADVPLLDPADIDRAVLRAETEGAMVVVPDRSEDGTNALIFPADAPPEFGYGPGSYLRHATAPGRPVIRLRLSSLALDVDTPADLSDLKRRSAGGALATGDFMAWFGGRPSHRRIEEAQS